VKIAVGSDHAGFVLKREVALHLLSIGHTVVDFGAYNVDDPIDAAGFRRNVHLPVINLSNLWGLVGACWQAIETSRFVFSAWRIIRSSAKDSPRLSALNRT